MKVERIGLDFFLQDVLKVAPGLLGKEIVRHWPGGKVTRHMITETEAYRGSEDLACHAKAGKTRRTRVMYEQGGVLYMYLIYGIYWMMNIVTEMEEIPQAVLIRGCSDISGPGRLTRKLELDGSFNGVKLTESGSIYIAESVIEAEYTAHPRIGIDYAGEEWSSKPWRYLMKP